MNLRRVALPLTLVGAAALGHIVTVVKGVHFKGARIDFGQPPARRKFGFDDGTGFADADRAWRPGTKYHEWSWQSDDGGEAHERRIAALKQRLMRASAAAEQHGRYREARQGEARLAELGSVSASFLGARTELFATPGLAGTKGVRAYLRATHPLTRGPLPQNVGQALQPWLAYDAATTAEAYDAVARRYPRSSRAPAALVMAIRLRISEGKRPSTETIHAAKSAAETILRDYPRSRFAWDAQGALGRIEVLKGRGAAAVPHYEAQLRTADDPRRVVRAHYSLMACARAAKSRAAVAYAALRWAGATESQDPYEARGHLYRALQAFTAADADAFYRRLAADPRAFAAYFDFRASLDPTAPDLLALADRARLATARSPFRGRVDAVLAEVALAAHDPRARAFAMDAEKAMGDDRAVGTFVLATLDRRAGRLGTARAGFRRILRESPKSYLVGGARENLALLAERTGDLSEAMDLYRVLGYEQDIAYLADARMSPTQLAAYVAKHPQDKALRYTLAMRWLRRGGWDAAEAALRPLSAADRQRLTHGKTSWGAVDWNSDDGGLQDPLVTARDLRRLDGALNRAKGDAARATALAAMGDYYFHHKCLLLYSGPVWKGERDSTIAFSWNPTVATATDDDALRAHYDEHECYVQAAARYRRVVREFPSSKVAPHAAYWAAVSLERLSRMAPYWRWRDAREDLKAEGVRLMALAVKSPDPHLAAKASKYAKVFADERAETRKAFADEKPLPRRWEP